MMDDSTTTLLKAAQRGMDDSTTTLVRAAQSGDVAALHALLQRCQPDLSRFARTVCATPEDAEDAVQEALWIAAQRIGALRVASALTSWLFQVVKRECWRLLRRVRREAPFEQQHEHALNHPAPDQQVQAHELVRAILDLPPPYRVVLIMRDVQGLTAPEVAASLGISAEAVKSRLHRARAQIRAALGG